MTGKRLITIAGTLTGLVAAGLIIYSSQSQALSQAACDQASATFVATELKTGASPALTRARAETMHRRCMQGRTPLPRGQDLFAR